MKFHSKTHQRGATLIVVMVVLLAVTIMGVVSVRQSRTNLSIANSAEVQNLLFQGSDLALAKLEEEARQHGADNRGFLVGYVNSGFKLPTADYEVVVCLRPIAQKSLLDKSKFSKIIAKNNYLVSNGACNVEKDEDYTSKRKVTLTQVAFTRGKPNIYGNNEDPPAFTNPGGATLTAHSLTLMPAFSSASAGDMNECLKNRVMNDYDDPTIETVSDCLEKLSVPTHAQIQAYDVTS